MDLDKNSSVAELRNELERKRQRALDLQTSTTDPGEWKNLNAIRWELDDLDKDLYLSEFIKNNDKLEKLIGQVHQGGAGAMKISKTLGNAKAAIQKARSELNKGSTMFVELDGYYKEVETMLDTLRNS